MLKGLTAPDDMAARFPVGSTSQIWARLVALNKVRKQMRTSQGKADLMEQANCGGLVTLENVRVIHYLPEKGG